MKSRNTLFETLRLVTAVLLLGSGILPAPAAEAPTIGNPPPQAGQLARYERLREWQLTRLLRDYHENGHHDPKWNASVERALEAFADMNARRLASLTHTQVSIMQPLRDAVNGGCHDPFVRFLYGRYYLPITESDAGNVVRWLLSAAEEMDQSKYHTVFKIYAGYRPQEVWIDSFGRNTNQTPPVPYASCRKPYEQASVRVQRILAEGKVPVEFAYDGCQETLLILRSNPGLKSFYDSVSGNLKKNWPDSAFPHLLRGTFYVHYAWLARGFGYADTVAGEAARLFNERQAEAEESLTKAWELDPSILKIVIDMLRLHKGQGKPREQMETWFRRGMTINPNSLEVCKEKLDYLAPRWLGSVKQELDFGRECLESTIWNGDVPIAMINAHENVVTSLPAERKKEYWADPAVWRDIKAACEKLVKTSPEGPNSARWLYLSVARRSQRWDELLQQASLLTATNFLYFGGKSQFDSMIAEARQKVSSPKGE